MTNKSKLHGCYIATLTPFDSTGCLDIGTVRAHAQWLISRGTEGLCPAGTTGEFLYLTTEEKASVVAESVNAVSGKVPVIAGVWGFTTSECKELANSAEENGAVGVFLPPPTYYPANDESIFEWYRSVHSATSLPVFAYNIPQYAANSLSIECLRRLFDEGIIAGVKDSTGKLDRVSSLIEQFGSVGTVFAASDGFASTGRKIGADGFISAIGNVTPELFSKVWNGDDSLQPQLDSIRTALKQVGSIPALKYLLTKLDFPFGESRIPCSTLTADQMEAMDVLFTAL